MSIMVQDDEVKPEVKEPPTSPVEEVPESEEIVGEDDDDDDDDNDVDDDSEEND